MAKYSIGEFGTKISTSYGMFISKDNQPISPWHDIPLYSDDSKKYFNMFVEIPRWTNAKMEISKGDKLNPIKQDVKKGKLRYVDNVYPYKGYIWNYGALPQTWEDPNHIDKDTNAKGDDDPLDICEIGSRVFQRGSVVPVKILGVLAMIDEGETDWKVIAIAKDDPMENKLNDIGDVEKHMPGYLNDTRRWFKLYKMPQGKPANIFAFNGEFKNREFADRVIKETHEFWIKLIKGETKSDWKLINLTVQDSKFKVPPKECLKIVEAAPKSKPAENDIDSSVEKWHFIEG